MKPIYLPPQQLHCAVGIIIMIQWQITSQLFSKPMSTQFTDTNTYLFNIILRKLKHNTCHAPVKKPFFSFYRRLQLVVLSNSDLFQYKITFPGMGISIIKIRQLWDHPIFIMGIHIAVRQHLYIEMAPMWLALPITRYYRAWQAVAMATGPRSAIYGNTYAFDILMKIYHSLSHCF